MALIKCPECGKEISDKAGSCPNCGCPIKQSTSEYRLNSNYDNSVKIKLPFFRKGIGKTREMNIKIEGKRVWDGYSSQTASFEIEEPCTISAYLSNVRIYPKLNVAVFVLCIITIIPLFVLLVYFLAKSKVGDALIVSDTVKPGKRYECKCIKADYLNGYLGSIWKLSEVDNIDSED